MRKMTTQERGDAYVTWALICFVASFFAALGTAYTDGMGVWFGTITGLTLLAFTVLSYLGFANYFEWDTPDTEED